MNYSPYLNDPGADLHHLQHNHHQFIINAHLIQWQIFTSNKISFLYFSLFLTFSYSHTALYMYIRLYTPMTISHHLIKMNNDAGIADFDHLKYDERFEHQTRAKQSEIDESSVSLLQIIFSYLVGVTFSPFWTVSTLNFYVGLPSPCVFHELAPI